MNTVEPPVRDPLKEGQPLYKGHWLRHHANTYSEIGKTSQQGTKLLAPKCPVQRFHYITVCCTYSAGAAAATRHRERRKVSAPQETGGGSGNRQHLCVTDLVSSLCGAFYDTSSPQ